MRDSIRRLIKQGENVSNLVFLIDLIIGTASNFKVWDGSIRRVGSNVSATEIGFDVIDDLLRSNDSPVKNCHIAVLTQRNDEAKMHDRLEKTNLLTPQAEEILIFSKNDSADKQKLIEWLERVCGVNQR